MKRFCYLSFLLVVFLQLFSGCKDPGLSPKEVTLKFMSAIQQSNYEEAKKYATADSKSMLDALAAFQQMLPEDSQEKFKNGKIAITHVKKNDSLAVVTYNSDQDTTQKTLKLRKQKGTWKIVFTREAVLPDLHSISPDSPIFNGQ